MFGIIGIIVIFGMVFGGYLLAGGKLGIIAKALPFEMMMIGGAAIGTFLIANDMSVVKSTGKSLKAVFVGKKWKADGYKDLLCMLSELMQLSKENPIDLEEHIDAPKNSAIISKYPEIQADETALELICDTFRTAAMNYTDPHQIEDVLEKRIDEILHHKLAPSHALQTVADGLPALGIVAAVLGVIKTMGSIDQPPEVLGKLIGGALVGTFLGVFLAYCFAAPFAGKMKEIAEEDVHFYKLIKDVLTSYFQGHPVNICVEVGRQTAPPDVRPSFLALEESVRNARSNAA